MNYGPRLCLISFCFGCGSYGCNAGEAYCEEDVEVVDSEAPWGAGTVQDVVERTLPGYEGTITWHGGGDEVVVTLSAGSTSVSLEFALPREILITRSEKVGGGPNDRLACSDSLEFVSNTVFETDDGSFAGRLVTKTVQVAGSSSLDVSFDPLSVSNQGSFRAVLAHPEDWDDGTELVAAGFTASGGIANGAVVLRATRVTSVEGNLEEGLGLDAKLGSIDLERVE